MRGQIILEFLLVLGIAIIIGILYLGLGATLFSSTSEQQRIDALNDVGYAVQDEIILASQVADGYERTFVVPDQADRFTYTLANDANSLTLHSGTVSLVYDLPNITGTLQKGKNKIMKNGDIVVMPG